MNNNNSYSLEKKNGIKWTQTTHIPLCKICLKHERNTSYETLSEGI